MARQVLLISATCSFNPSSTHVPVSRGFPTSAAEQNKVHHHVHLRLPRNPSNITQSEGFHGTVDQTLLCRRMEAQPVTSCDGRTPNPSSTVLKHP